MSGGENIPTHQSVYLVQNKCTAENVERRDKRESWQSTKRAHMTESENQGTRLKK